jgi:D-glycero-D-manno-heptose 1,7-bisphosphate phosphatase
MTAAGCSTPATNDPIAADGVWCEVRHHARHGGAALFLDRDGVVVEEIDHLCRVEDVVVLPGAGAVIGAANRRGIRVVLITNQAGIGRGLYGWAEFMAVQNAIIAALEAQGARFDAVYACPHHPNGKGDFWHPDHPARKPNPGMILRAAADLDLDLKRSWLVGDKTIDVEAAKRAGLAGAMQVMTGYGEAEWPSSAALSTENFEVRQGRSIADAATLPIFAPA